MAACGSNDGSSSAPRYRLRTINTDSVVAPVAGDLNGGVWQVAVATEAGEAALGVTLGVRLTTTAAGLVLTDTLALSGNAGITTVRVRASAPAQTGTMRLFVIGQPDSEISINVRAVDGLAVTAVAPSSLSAGDTITVRGRRFGSNAGAVQVRIGNQQANVVALSGDTLIRATMPSCVAAAVQPVTVQIATAVVAAGSVTTLASATPTRLAPYQRLVVSDTALARGCLTLPADGARYVLMPQLASALDGGGDNPGDSTVVYLLSAQTTGAVVAPALFAPAAIEAPAPETEEPTSVADRFHRGLRNREQTLAATASPAPPFVETPFLIAPPALNSQRTFQVLSSLDPGASNFREVRARLAYAGDHVLVYVDAAPAAANVGFTAAEITAMGPLLDGPMHELATQNFGGETDVDGNGRVILLLTDAVNRLTPPPCGQGYIAGFFNPLDFFPGQRGSNNAEIFYAAVPDPAGSVGCALTSNQLVATTPATFIHEFQHMISYGQHVLVRRGSSEEIWANEGLSHLAEEMAGLVYELRYPTGQRSNPTNFFPDSAQAFSAPQLQNAYRWLNGLQGATATVTAYGATGSLAERGASWLFFRYLVAQYGPALPARLVATRRTGRANVVAETGVPFSTLYGDFAAAIWADSIVGAPAANVPSRFRFGPLRNLRRIFARLNVANPQEFRDVFPIRADSVVVGGAPRQGRLRPGAIQYTFLNTPASGPGVTVRMTRDNGGSFVSRSNPQLVVLRLP